MIIHQTEIYGWQYTVSERWMSETSNNKCMDGKTSYIAYLDENTSDVDDETSDKACIDDNTSIHR